jgi:NADH-quinone oxidoreductase subunit N
MISLIQAIFPELVLMGVACIVMLMGAARSVNMRRAAAGVALLALVFVFAYQWIITGTSQTVVISDGAGALRVFGLAQFVKLMTSGVGIMLVLLAWPSNADATGSASLDFATECGEFFGLMLLSIAGVFLVAGANDIITLFLGIELASIPTYIMVSVSRPIAAAQEAGVKYFFLGAMAAALMLFGFSYLYGMTGQVRLDEIGRAFAAQNATAGHPILQSWAMLGVLMLGAGFAFKLAAVPLHFYAGDVYQGAATPVTAFLSFIPKTSGMIALLKLVYVAGGNNWAGPETLTKLLWAVALLTMCVGNSVALWQLNVKRVLAYSSIAHSGYMLVGIAALSATHDATTQQHALEGVLFYLAAYGIMNVGAFGVLMLLPAKPHKNWAGEITPAPPATTAETFEDIAGQGRRHPALGLAMAICCFSLMGIPLTVGFLAKVYIIRPALDAHLYWLVVLTMLNAGVSAGYYLKIVGTMFLRVETEDLHGPSHPMTLTPIPEPGGVVERLLMPAPIRVSVILSVIGTLLFGIVMPATQVLSSRVSDGAHLDLPAQETPAVAITASR